MFNLKSILTKIRQLFAKNSASGDEPQTGGDPLRIESTTLFVHGIAVDTHEIVEEIGRGANGVVYRARNRTLDRMEALKVWIKLRENDSRDKCQQGIQEAGKLARVNGKHAVQIYDARVIGSAIIATMEYIPGITLREFRKKLSTTREVVDAAKLYLKIIEETSAPDTFHGDPHWNNVLAFEDQSSKYEKGWRFKLCDFGTSIFSKEGYSEERHWRIVRETIRELTKSLPGSEEAWEQTKDFGRTARSLYDSMAERPDLFSPQERASARLAGLRDYLDFWRYA